MSDCKKCEINKELLRSLHYNYDEQKSDKFYPLDISRLFEEIKRNIDNQNFGKARDIASTGINICIEYFNKTTNRL